MKAKINVSTIKMFFDPLKWNQQSCQLCFKNNTKQGIIKTPWFTGTMAGTWDKIH